MAELRSNPCSSYSMYAVAGMWSTLPCGLSHQAGGGSAAPPTPTAVHNLTK